MGSEKSRFVFDTNVLVSAAFRADSTSGQCLGIALEKGIVLLSLETAEELAEVLLRDKFDRYVSVEAREAFLQAFIEETEVIEVTQTVRACRDRRDDKFLELAVSGRAHYLVTGDDDLLVLHPFRGISILSPSAVLQEAGKER